MNTKLNIESIIDGSIEKGKLAESVQESLSNIERLENNIIDKQDTITDLDDIRDGANKGKTSVQSITINGESKTPDENGIIDLGNIEGGGVYVTTLAYKATSKVENTEYPWDKEEGEYTFGVPIIRHDFDANTGVIYFRGRITTIGYGAFANCSSLTSITIPDSVTTIGEGAFYNCGSLTSVTIPNSVTTIVAGAFNNCSSLTSVTIPDSVTTIGNGAFNGCSSLTSVTIPNSVTTIGSNAFFGCTGELIVNCNIPSVTDYLSGAFYGGKFTSVTIGDSVTTIGDHAFYNCTSLTSVTIGNSVTTIGARAFDYCMSLTSVTIPDSVTSIGNEAFYRCGSLTSVYCKAVTPPAEGYGMFDDNFSGRKIYVPIKSIDAYKSATGWSDYADDIVGYIFNAKLQSITINGESKTPDENGVVDLGKTYVTTLAYKSTSKVENTEYPWSDDTFGAPIIRHDYDEPTGVGVIYFNDRITTIGERAFSNCTSLTSVIIPDSVTTIGEDAFYQCSSLTSITIPNSVTTIGGAAFRNCDSLTSITIPDSVTTIREWAFADCDSLKRVYCKATTPPAGGSSMFYYIASGRKIYVPMESVDAYKSASYWSDYDYNIVGYRFNANFNDYYTKSETNDIIEDTIVTESTVSGWGFTKNTGTITGVSANGTSIATSGVANIPAASISNYGVTKLSSLTNSTSTILAATPKAVKSAYDLADSKYTKPEDGISYEDLHVDVQSDLSLARNSVQPSDIEYAVVSFTIDNIDNCIIDGFIQFTIDYESNNDNFRHGKPLMIKKNSDSAALYPLTYTRTGNALIMSYSGTVSCVVEGVTYEFYISYNATKTVATISDIKRYYNNYVADFRIYDLYNIIDENVSKSIDTQKLYLAIKNNKTIVVYTNEYDPDYSKGVMNILTGGITSDDTDIKVFDCVINTHNGSWKLTDLEYDTTSQDGHICYLNNSNVKFCSAKPYVLEFTYQEFIDLLNGYLPYIQFNSANLANALNEGIPVSMKYDYDYGANFSITGYAEDLLYFNILTDNTVYIVSCPFGYISDDPSTKYTQLLSNDISRKVRISDIAYSFNFDNGVKLINGSDNLIYALPGTTDGDEDEILLGTNNVKTINNISIRKSSSSDNNIFTYYSESMVTVVGTADRAVTCMLSPNVLYNWGDNIPINISILLGRPYENVVNEYVLQFKTTDTVPTIGFPSSVKWTSGSAPTLEENKVYQISIINGLGVVLEWDNV